MDNFPKGERFQPFTLQEIAKQKGLTEEELAQFTQLVLYGSEAVTFEEGKLEPEAATTVVEELPKSS